MVTAVGPYLSGSPPRKKGLHFRVSVGCPVIGLISKTKKNIKGVHLSESDFCPDLNNSSSHLGERFLPNLQKKRSSLLRKGLFFPKSPKTKKGIHFWESDFCLDL